MPLGTRISRKTSVLWWSADCRNISRSDSLPPADTLYFSASCILQGKEEKKKPFLYLTHLFCRHLHPRLSLTKQMISRFTLLKFPSLLSMHRFLCRKIWSSTEDFTISSPGTGGILGQAEIHRLIPDLWKLTSKPSPSSMGFNSLYRCWLLLCKIINELQIRLLNNSCASPRAVVFPMFYLQPFDDVLYERKSYTTLVQMNDQARSTCCHGRSRSRRARAGHFLPSVGLPPASTVVVLQMLPPYLILSCLSCSQYVSCSFWEPTWWSALVPIPNRLFFYSKSC